MRQINKIVIDSSESDYGTLNSIHSKHTLTIEQGGRGYRTIGYHYVICNGKAYATDKYNQIVQDGHTEIGRPIGMASGCIDGNNINTISICLVGTIDFTDEQFYSLCKLLEKLLDTHSLSVEDIFSSDNFIYGKKDFIDLDSFKKQYMLYVDKVGA